MYGQRQEDHLHRFRDAYPIDARMSERMREEQVQQHTPGREDHYSREREMRERDMRERDMREREMRDREMHMQEAQYRDNMMRRQAPPDQRGGGGPPTQPMEWTRHPPQPDTERWNR